MVLTDASAISSHPSVLCSADVGSKTGEAGSQERLRELWKRADEAWRQRCLALRLTRSCSSS